MHRVHGLCLQEIGEYERAKVEFARAVALGETEAAGDLKKLESQMRDPKNEKRA